MALNKRWSQGAASDTSFWGGVKTPAQTKSTIYRGLMNWEQSFGPGNEFSPTLDGAVCPICGSPHGRNLYEVLEFGIDATLRVCDICTILFGDCNKFFTVPEVLGNKDIVYGWYSIYASKIVNYGVSPLSVFNINLNRFAWTSKLSLTTAQDVEDWDYPYLQGDGWDCVSSCRGSLVNGDLKGVLHVVQSDNTLVVLDRRGEGYLASDGVWVTGSYPVEAYQYDFINSPPPCPMIDKILKDTTEVIYDYQPFGISPQKSIIDLPGLLYILDVDHYALKYPHQEYYNPRVWNKNYFLPYGYSDTIHAEVGSLPVPLYEYNTELNEEFIDRVVYFFSRDSYGVWTELAAGSTCAEDYNGVLYPVSGMGLDTLPFTVVRGERVIIVPNYITEDVDGYRSIFFRVESWSGVDILPVRFQAWHNELAYKLDMKVYSTTEDWDRPFFNKNYVPYYILEKIDYSNPLESSRYLIFEVRTKQEVGTALHVRVSYTASPDGRNGLNKIPLALGTYSSQITPYNESLNKLADTEYGITMLISKYTYLCTFEFNDHSQFYVKIYREEDYNGGRPPLHLVKASNGQLKFAYEDIADLGVLTNEYSTLVLELCSTSSTYKILSISVVADQWTSGGDLVCGGLNRLYPAKLSSGSSTTREFYDSSYILSGKYLAFFWISSYSDPVRFSVASSGVFRVRVYLRPNTNGPFDYEQTEDNRCVCEYLLGGSNISHYLMQPQHVGEGDTNSVVWDILPEDAQTSITLGSSVSLDYSVMGFSEYFPYKIYATDYPTVTYVLNSDRLVNLPQENSYYDWFQLAYRMESNNDFIYYDFECDDPNGLEVKLFDYYLMPITIRYWFIVGKCIRVSFISHRAVTIVFRNIVAGVSQNIVCKNCYSIVQYPYGPPAFDGLVASNPQIINPAVSGNLLMDSTLTFNQSIKSSLDSTMSARFFNFADVLNPVSQANFKLPISMVIEATDVDLEYSYYLRPNVYSDIYVERPDLVFSDPLVKHNVNKAKYFITVRDNTVQNYAVHQLTSGLQSVNVKILKQVPIKPQKSVATVYESVISTYLRSVAKQIPATNSPASTSIVPYSDAGYAWAGCRMESWVLNDLNPFYFELIWVNPNGIDPGSMNYNSCWGFIDSSKSFYDSLSIDNFDVFQSGSNRNTRVFDVYYMRAYTPEGYAYTQYTSYSPYTRIGVAVHPANRTIYITNNGYNWEAYLNPSLDKPTYYNSVFNLNGFVNLQLFVAFYRGSRYSTVGLKACFDHALCQYSIPNGFGELTAAVPSTVGDGSNLDCPIEVDRSNLILTDNWNSYSVSKDRSGSYARFFRFKTFWRGQITVKVSSTSISPYLMIYDKDKVGFIHESDFNLDNVLELTAELVAGQYYLVVTTFEGGVGVEVPVDYDYSYCINGDSFNLSLVSEFILGAPEGVCSNSSFQFCDESTECVAAGGAWVFDACRGRGDRMDVGFSMGDKTSGVELVGI